MEVCKLGNFNRDEINITFSNEGDINSYKEEIKNWIDSKKWFAKNIEDSQYPEDWESSINNLFDLLIEYAENQQKGPNVKEAIEALRKDFLHKKVSPAKNDPNSPELPQGDLPKKQEKEEKKLSEELKTFFSGDRILLQDFQENFKHRVYDLTVIQIGNNLDSSTLITDVEDINKGVLKFMNGEYKKVYNFLQSHGVDLSKIALNMYTASGKDLGHLNPSYSDLLDLFLNYIENHYTDISKTLYQDYENKYNRKDHVILDSIYAYLNIRHFNDLLSTGFRDYFYINNKQQDLIIKEDNKTKYKYGINRRHTQLLAGWETNTVRDGVKEFGSFSSMIIEQIPLSNTIGYLKKNDAILGLLKLKYAIERSDNIDLKRALFKININTVEGWKEVLELVHKLIVNNTTTSLIKSSSFKILEGDDVTQKNTKLTQIDLDNIESIYQYFFNKQSGIYYIQRNNTFLKGISRNYDIVSSVFGSIRSTTQAHYLETVYDHNTKSYVLRIKTKNNSYNDIHNLIKQINNYSIQNPETDSDFTLNTNTGEVSIGGITIQFKEKSNGIFGISNKTVEKISGIEDKTVIDSYFRKQLDKLHSFSGRESLLKSQDPKDLKFLNLLKFIDKNLTTDFSTGDLGLQTLRTLILTRDKKKNTVFQDLLLNALRISSAKQLNIRLRDKVNKDISNIDYIIKYKNEFPPYKFFDNINNKSNNLTLFEDDYWFVGVENTMDNDIFDDIVSAQKIINREDNKSTTKNNEGNSLPNVSVYFTDIISEFYSQGDNTITNNDSTNYITKNLLFSGIKADAILSTYIDNEVETEFGETKGIDQFTTSELFYHSFMNKFIIPMQKNIFVAQPITYSDKKKFLNFPVLVSSISGYQKNVFALRDTAHERILMNSAGNYYKSLFEKVCQDYRDLFGITSENNLEVFFQANAYMKNETEQSLMSRARTRSKVVGRDIKLYKDLHYRNIGGKTSANELLYYYVNTIFGNENTLHNFLLKEKAKYINQLLDSYSLIKVNKNISDLFDKVPNTNISQWSIDGYLKFAKKNGRYVEFGEKISEEDILSGRVQINPILNTYFYMSNVINNNIKLGLMGHELHHKIKQLKDVTKNLGKELNLNINNILEAQEHINSEQRNLGESYELLYDESGEKLNPNTVIQLSNKKQITVQEYENILKQEEINIAQEQKKIDNALYSLLSLAQNAQFKRTVAIPGTIRPFTQGKLDGITPTYNVAFIDDIKALVYDYKGNYGWKSDGKNEYNDSKDEDAHDGAAFQDPFTSILENNSLDDQEVGDVKKPLWDIDDPVYGARGLIKYAVNSITNKLMLQSKKSNLKLHMLFKKMTDQQWGENEIDLTKDWAIVPYNSQAFGKYIINDENPLFYKYGNEYRQIINFGKDEKTGVYYTQERIVNIHGRPVDNQTHKIYHLFTKDGNSSHLRVKDLPQNWEQNYTRINSLYQLHSALGGIYSHSLIDGNLKYSEASNKAVAQFMIYVSKAKNTNTKEIKASQEDFYQPLKYKLINYVVNDSAAKNGVNKINPRERFFDKNPLEYTTLSTLKYGIQQDSDHEADEAELTEMTQVISALDATGYYHDEIYDIYNAIGEQIISSLELEYNALKDSNPSKLYDLVGKTIINNFSDRKGMVKAVLDQMEKVFNLTTNHKYDLTKCPFSDATLYNKILQTLGSVMNRKGIKRTYSGSGMVMTPGYDIYQVWEINGVPMQYEDILNEALAYNKKTNLVQLEGDQELYNEQIVENYLNATVPDSILYEYDELSSEQDFENRLELGIPIPGLENVKPESTVTINYKTVDGKEDSKQITLNSVPKYYEFKFNTKEFIEKITGLNNLTITSIVQNNKIPRNLSPVKINFSYQDGINEKSINIFDSKIYIDLYKATKNKNDLEVALQQSRINTFLINLENNIYTEWNSDRNKTEYKITKKDIQPAETILSNIYKTAFNIKDGDSLYDILKAGPKYFKHLITPLNGQLYDFDIQLISENGLNNIYISLDANDSNELYQTRNIKWDSEHKNKEKISEEERGNSKVVNRVYLINNDSQNQFEIGRELDVSDEIKYDETSKKFLDIKTNKEVTGRKLYLDEDDKVVEYFEFITQSKIIPNEGTSFIRYNINQENLKKVLLPSEDSNGKLLPADVNLNNSISKIINDFYQSDSFLMVQPSENLRSEHYNQVKKIFKGLKNISNNEDFTEYCDNIVNNVLTLSQNSIKNSEYIQLSSGNKSKFKPEILEKYGIIKSENNKTLTPQEIIQRLTIFKNQNPQFKEEINNLINSYNYSSLKHWNQQFIDKYVEKKFISFKKSLEFISSRIPAQTLQSFMTMKCVGYTGVDTNYCAVSHFQTFLQGSDYDIDKSYMMGLNFDNSGMYYNWSNLFDFTSIETLRASEQLPLSKGFNYSSEKSGIDVTKQAIEVLKYQEHTPEYIIAISNLLKNIYRYKYLSNFIKEGKKVSLTLNLTPDNVTKILNILNKHEKTILPKFSKDLVLKNFISSHIQQISNKLGNLGESYTPVEMNDLRDPAKNTPKSKLAQSLTLFNPAMINVMQFQNMSGKQVTGIAANGQKALFMWRTATLDAIKNNKDLEYVSFDLELDGILNRSKYDNDTDYKDNPKHIQILPNLYTDSEFYKQCNKLFPKVTSDNIGSQYISAATDNAKELILACINAGNKMAKCHLYLMSLGFDVADIVRFMTSDAVSFIDKITDQNIFNRYNLDINYAITWAIGFINNPNSSKLEKVPSVLKTAFEKEINSLRNTPKFDRFKKDLLTLQKVLAGANEFSSFGRLLGINQGIPQTKEDLISWKNGIKNVIKNAEKKLLTDKTKNYDSKKLAEYNINQKTYSSVMGKNFDVDRWLKDSSYRKLTMEYYNLIKESLNIFYYMDNIPHFKQMFGGLYILNEVDQRISLKGKLMNEFSNKLREIYPYAPKNYEKKLEPVFNELFIERFIKGMNLSIKVDSSWNKFNSDFKLIPIKQNILRLDTDSSLASFKYIFEQYIIPKLKEGTLNIKDKNELYNNPDIREFLNGLVISQYNEIPYYKMNLNMTLKDIDPSTKLKYSKFLKGINALKKYKWGEHNISDLFILYNLIVNKNQYGSERMTELFEDFVTDFENKHNQNESYIMKYFRTLGNWDYYKNILKSMLDTVTITDLLMKVAPIVRANSINNVKRSDPIVKIFTPDGIKYYENTDYSNYAEIPSLLVQLDDETPKEYKERQRNQYKYGFGLPYMNYINNLIESLRSDSPIIVQNSLDNLIKSGLIKYNVNCE